MRRKNEVSVPTGPTPLVPDVADLDHNKVAPVSRSFASMLKVLVLQALDLANQIVFNEVAAVWLLMQWFAVKK